MVSPNLYEKHSSTYSRSLNGLLVGQTQRDPYLDTIIKQLTDSNEENFESNKREMTYHV